MTDPVEFVPAPGFCLVCQTQFLPPPNPLMVHPATFLPNHYCPQHLPGRIAQRDQGYAAAREENRAICSVQGHVWPPEHWLGNRHCARCGAHQ